MELEFGNKDEFEQKQAEEQRKRDLQNKPIPEGTEANIKMIGPWNKEARQNDPLTSATYEPITKKKNGDPCNPYIRINWEVVDGEYEGKRGSNFVSINPDNSFFRHLFELATGQSLDGGGKFQYSDFTEGLIKGVFSARLGPQKPMDGGEPKYSEAKWFLEKVGEVDRADVPDPELRIGGDATNDENVPF